MQSRKTQQNKYLQPQVFSITAATRSHCRSLVDLNSIDNSAEKENANYEHYSSVLSSQPDRNALGIKSGSNGTTGVRQPLSNQKNISNIAKILMGNSKNKHDFNTSKNNSFVQISATTMLKSKNQATQQRKNDLISSIPKNEMRTSSQTNLREIGVLTKTVTHRNQGQPSLERDRSEKSLNKVRKNEEKLQSKEVSEHNLMVKLKEYIEELKLNEKNNVALIESLKNESKQLKQENTLLIDKIEVYLIREKEMIRKIKALETNRNNEKMAPNKAVECQEHQLIIQSLKNVINEQMTKIIEFETYKVQKQQEEKLRNLHSKMEGNEKKSWEKEESERESDQEQDQIEYENEHDDQYHKEHEQEYKRTNEVYSFKKRNKLNESSIYIEEEEQINSCSTSKLSSEENWPNYEDKKKKVSFSNIPEPYNGLIKCLKSDSRISEKPKSQSSSSMMSVDNSRRSSFIKEENYEEEEEVSKYKTQCSEDEILQEVGQYLSYIRKNVREN